MSFSVQQRVSFIRTLQHLSSESTHDEGTTPIRIALGLGRNTNAVPNAHVFDFSGLRVIREMPEMKIGLTPYWKEVKLKEGEMIPGLGASFILSSAPGPG